MLDIYSIVRKVVPVQEKIFFDLGSSNTRVLFRNTIVFNEPTCIAIHAQTDAIVAIGQKAASLLGKTPETIKVIFPVRAGRVVSIQLMQRFLEAIIQQTISNTRISAILGFDCVIALPVRISPVELMVWQRSLKAAGIYSVEVIKSATALYASTVGPKSLSHSICIIDIGGQKTDIAVLSAGEIAVAKTIQIGGVECTEAVQDNLRNHEQFIVGWQSAEKAKKEILCISDKNKKKDKKLAIRGKDIQNHVARTMVINSGQFKEEMKEYADRLVQEMKQFFSLIPSELAATILERGIYLAGGGAQLCGLRELLQDELKTEMILVAEPDLSTIKGLQKLYAV